MNAEAAKITLSALFDHFIKNNEIDRTGDLDTDADALYHRICLLFDLDVILEKEIGSADAVIINGKKALGVGLVLAGSDYLMELCYQHFGQ